MDVNGFMDELGRSLPLLFSLFVVACAGYPEITTDCESYGVTEAGQPMGEVVHIAPLTLNELQVRCAAAEEVTVSAQVSAEIRGCAIPHRNGFIEAYYWVGDNCAMQHELCHARHGPGHTVRYLRELSAGIPRPYCPTNQLIRGSLTAN